MRTEHPLRILTALGCAESATEPRVPSVLSACASLVEASGAGLMLMTDAGSRHAVHASDDLMGQLDALQVGLGEGPSIDAYVTGLPALEHNVADQSRRWPAFAPAAMDIGAQAVFAFPLGGRLGTLNLYRDRPRPLSAEQLSDAEVSADLVTDVVVDLHHRLIDDYGVWPPQIHQATGILAVQLNVSPAIALGRLRAEAFARECPLSQLASLVVKTALLGGSESIAPLVGLASSDDGHVGNGRSPSIPDA